jgi:membrane-bound lytic murein transglycosylase D
MKLLKTICQFSAASVLFISLNTKAQTLENIDSEIVKDTLPQIQYPIDLQVVDSRDGKSFNIKIENPQLIEERLKSIENIMPMVYNESVKVWLDFFMLKRPSFTQEMMENKDFYFPIFQKYLKENNMPEELKYLALLESGLNPKAVSRSKAVGLWQFMSLTGKEMGLTINDYIDERMHIEKSTEAACKYLKRLHNMFNDWDLALASYNTGPGRISRTMKATGLSNYWDLHAHIHPDTRAYVPQFIALAYLMNFGNEHGIFPEKNNNFIQTEKFAINGNLDLKTLSELSKLDYNEFKRFNPHFKKDILPESGKSHEISLPDYVLPYFMENRNAIIDSSSRRNRSQNTNKNEEVLLANNELNYTEDGALIIGNNKLVPDLVVSNSVDTKYEKITRTVKKTHKVRKGEFLNKIASKYDVSMNEIKKWNNKKSSKVLVGERLVIYVNETTKVKSNSLAVKSSTENIKGLTHTVKRGDTLWNISQKYEGVSIDDLKKWNNISGNTVKVGQKIKIKV